MNKTHYLLLILFAAFIVSRLYFLDYPPLDTHEWRQTLTITMAKEYMDHPNIMYPRTNIGEFQDLLAAEFPVFSYVMMIMYKIFGFHDWFGRLINLSVSLLGLFYFYKLCSELWDEKMASLASILMTSSIVFEFARKSMPDTFSMFLNIIGVYYILQYLTKEKKWHLILGILLCALGVLNKISFINIWAFLIIPFLDWKVIWKKKILVTGLMSIIVLLAGLWYFYWVPHLLSMKANQLFWSFSISEGWQMFYDLRIEAWGNLRDSTFHSIYLFYFTLLGLIVFLIKNKMASRLFALGYFSVFALFCIKSGVVFPTHNYYVIPIIPLLATCGGYLLSLIPVKQWILILATLFISYPGLEYNHIHAHHHHSRNPFLKLPEIADQFIPKDARIIVNGGSFNPFMMYWAGRKGWTFSTENFLKEDWIYDLKSKGVHYVIQDRQRIKEPLGYPIIYEDQDFIVYKP